MSEIWTREQPYDDLGLSSEEVVGAVGQKSSGLARQTPPVKQAWTVDGTTKDSSVADGLRPTIFPDTPPPYRELMSRCWHEEPEQRPNFKG